MLNSHYKGLFYEFISLIFLMCKGHRILKWRYKTPVGEIDIISKRRKKIFINEVKYRNNIEDAYHFTNQKYRDRLEKTFYWWRNNNKKFLSYDFELKYIFWHKKLKVKYVALDN